MREFVDINFLENDRGLKLLVFYIVLYFSEIRLHKCIISTIVIVLKCYITSCRDFVINRLPR